MQKLLGGGTFTDEFIEQIPDAFQMHNNDQVTLNDWEMLFESNRFNQKQPSVPSLSAVQIRNQQTSKQNQSEEHNSIRKYLAECIESEFTPPDQFKKFFHGKDKNFNNVLRVDELKEHIKAELPDKFAGLNLKKLSVALDVNNQGIITQSEFIELMRSSTESSADISGFNKITKALGGSPVKVRHQTENSKPITQKVLPKHAYNNSTDAIASFKLINEVVLKLKDVPA